MHVCYDYFVKKELFCVFGIPASKGLLNVQIEHVQHNASSNAVIMFVLFTSTKNVQIKETVFHQNNFEHGTTLRFR